jgi:ABC-type spermidine/putrescine transport system permease subunit II
MSNQKVSDVKTVNMTVVLVCVTTLISIVMISCVMVFWIAPEGTNTFALIVILVAQLPAIVAGVGALIGVRSVKADTQSILNGTMEGKVERVMHSVLDERADRDVTVSLPE